MFIDDHHASVMFCDEFVAAEASSFPSCAQVQHFDHFNVDGAFVGPSSALVGPPFVLQNNMGKQKLLQGRQSLLFGERKRRGGGSSSLT